MVDSDTFTLPADAWRDQEFCEWITCINTYPEGLKASTLQVPNFQKESFDADELLEL